MRAVLRSLGLGWALLAGLSLALGTALTASPALAQFDDEFDDEFESEPEPEPEPEPRPAADEDPFDDEFDDGFDDEGDSTADAAEGDGAVDDEDPAAIDDDEDEDDDEEDESVRERLFRAQNTYLGPTGGLHVVDAGSGAVGSFRVQLATDFFFANDFIVQDDDADHIGGSLSISWTVHEMVELFASVQSYANANDQEDPELFQVLGDTHLGIKAFYRVLPFLTVGGDLDLALLNTVGDIGLVFKSTSFGIRGNVTADLRGLDNPVPFIARLNLQYFFDNSNNLVEDVEQARYDNLDMPAPCGSGEDCEEFRHLLTPVERFALGINRTDFFNIALGFELPLEVGEDFYLQPLVEWVWNIPVNRQGYDCLYRPAERELGLDDGCLAEQGVGSFPMNLTLGARILPPVEGLSFLLAADVGLTGKKRDQFVRELAPNAPYNLYLGLAYAYDTVEPPAPEPVVREVERRVEVAAELPLEGRIHGTIVEQGAGTPVSGATIAFNGRDLTSLVAADDGTFTSYRLPPGEVLMDLSHPEYNPGQCAATIPEERPQPTGTEGEAAEGEEAASGEEGPMVIEVRCELVALPRVGGIAGIVKNADGEPVTGASIQLNGPATRTISTGPDGRFTVTDLPPGTYGAVVDADDYLIKTEQLEVIARENAAPTITLVPRPRNALVRLRNRDIQIRRKINFATNSAEILPSSEPLLIEIADVIIRHPELTKLEIQGHTDNRGSDARNTELSQSRAESVRNWLIGNGIDGSRLTARGYGPSRPLVPNITPANRARNRRVQFVIEERVEPEGE
ncbi:MAG: OmpA family protein [Deltaproteobacteria bacterium]|nr:OmpA family protein [Deltaproteobacteria bacterium]